MSGFRQREDITEFKVAKMENPRIVKSSGTEGQGVKDNADKE